MSMRNRYIQHQSKRQKRLHQKGCRGVLMSLGIFLIVGVFGYLHITGASEVVSYDSSGSKTVFMDVVGLGVVPFVSRADTVGEALEGFREEFLSRWGEIEVFPSKEAVLSSGMTIRVTPCAQVVLVAEGQKQEITTTANDVREVLLEAKISLSRTDRVVPGLYAPVLDGMEIEVVRVRLQEETVRTDIPYDTIIKEDDNLGWQEVVVESAGSEGVLARHYEVTYHNGEEVDRVLITETIETASQDRVEIHGTHVELGKKHTGQASWYSFTGTMSAANPWLPKGSYAKVTNIDNGKSVIVKINDRGPFVPGRIIDLDRVAFEKIASVGVGVINVIMEEVEN